MEFGFEDTTEAKLIDPISGYLTNETLSNL